MSLIFGLFFATSLDVAGGIFIPYLICAASGHAPQWWHYALGIFFSVLPDIDTLPQLFQGKEIDSEHRNLLHKPLPVIFLLLSFTTMFSAFISLLAALCIICHYLHDSIGDASGWGIQWFWPFSENQFQFFGKKEKTRKLLIIWTPQELKKISPLPLRLWLKRYYLKATPETVGGTILLVSASLLALWSII